MRFHFSLSQIIRAGPFSQSIHHFFPFASRSHPILFSLYRSALDTAQKGGIPYVACLCDPFSQFMEMMGHRLKLSHPIRYFPCPAYTSISLFLLSEYTIPHSQEHFFLAHFILTGPQKSFEKVEITHGGGYRGYACWINVLIYPPKNILFELDLQGGCFFFSFFFSFFFFFTEGKKMGRFCWGGFFVSFTRYVLCSPLP